MLHLPPFPWKVIISPDPSKSRIEGADGTNLSPIASMDVMVRPNEVGKVQVVIYTRDTAELNALQNAVMPFSRAINISASNSGVRAIGVGSSALNEVQVDMEIFNTQYWVEPTVATIEQKEPTYEERLAVFDGFTLQEMQELARARGYDFVPNDHDESENIDIRDVLDAT